jgi:hypothetical protein
MAVFSKRIIGVLLWIKLITNVTILFSFLQKLQHFTMARFDLTTCKSAREDDAT